MFKLSNRIDLSASITAIKLWVDEYGVFGQNRALLRVFNRPRLPPYFYPEEYDQSALTKILSTSWVSIVFDVRDSDESFFTENQACSLKQALYPCGLIPVPKPNTKAPTSSQFRWQMKKKTRRLAEQGEITFATIPGRDISDELFERFFELLASSSVPTIWGKQKNKATLNELVRVDDSTFHILSIGDKAVAIAQCQVVNNTLVYMIPTYDQDYAHDSPGIVLLNHIMTETHERDMALDLGKGVWGYKTRFRMETFPLSVLIMASHWTAIPVAHALNILLKLSVLALRFNFAEFINKLREKAKSSKSDH